MRSWVAGAVALLAAVVIIPPASAGEQLLMPDLRQAPPGCHGGYTGDPAECEDWDVCMVADADAPNGDCIGAGIVLRKPVKAVRLRFTTAEENVGQGPLLLFGRRAVNSPTMEVRQGFQAGRHGQIPVSYTEARQQTNNSMYYEPAPMHRHWHLMGFEQMQLRTPDGRTVVRDRKNGFCLGDRYANDANETLPNAPRVADTPEYRLSEYLRDNRCAFDTPGATDVKVGISVGQGDDYRYDVDFQWLDITSMPSGTYDLVNTVNSTRTLLESDYTNNSSSMALSIQWPQGAKQAPQKIVAPPTVKLLAGCPGQERCAATQHLRPRVSSDRIVHPKGEPRRHH
ncbi:lysyl oxidase [Actinosynnema sp. ALI-1.44]|uniref:lysyl oxidase family protein n=1 Tax=Actinosynnema sp. ALI-1.44 TaxID=1933779 RepID=UPI00097C254F|nr:lysyl oxidase family protein [Actinosynnema sp. ALI-1.44]ONI87437.1 lysyl oxidase [Actinosynnema sp. ALI-1.44]